MAGFRQVAIASLSVLAMLALTTAESGAQNATENVPSIRHMATVGNGTSKVPLPTMDPHEGEDPEDNVDEDEVTLSSALLGALVFFVGAAMANSAGVGGGAVFVPVFNLVMREDLKHSTALSQVSVTAGAVVAVMLSINKRNPLAPARMLIEVEFVLLLMPAMLLGISIGVLFNVALEVWLQKLLMVTLYAYLSYITTTKGVSLLKKELAAKRTAAAALSDGMAYQPLPAAAAEGGPLEEQQQQAQVLHRWLLARCAAAVRAFGGAGVWARGVLGHIRTAVRQEMDSNRPRAFPLTSLPPYYLQVGGEAEEEGAGAAAAAAAPWANLPANGLAESKEGAWAASSAAATSDPPLVGPGTATWAALVALWTLYFAFSLLHHTRPFCVRCSPSFWGLYAAMGAATTAITAAILIHLTRKHSPRAVHPHLRAPLLQGEEEGVEGEEDGQGIDWSMRNLARCALIMGGAGLMAGFMGIGGGMIMSPLLLTLNVHPQVTAATSSLMVLFSSSAASVQLGLEGMIDPWLAASFGVLAMVSSGTGIVVVRRVIQKFGTTSIIVLILGAFIGAAAVIILVSGIMEFEVVDKSHFKMFYNICKREAVSSAAACFM